MTMASILRHRRRHHFTVVPNPVLRDQSLSFRAKGLLCYLLSLPDGSPVDARLLVSEGSEGRDAIRTAFGELVEAGYASRWREQQPNGQWITLTEISDVPEKPASVPGPENPASVDQAIKSQRTNDEETKANPSYRTENPGPGNGAAAPPKRAAAPFHSNPGPVLTDDRGTFLPGTGWVT